VESAALAQRATYVESSLREEIAALQQKAKDVELSLRNKIVTLEELVQQVRQDALQVSRDEWFESIANASYRKEIEVEVKSIHPLLRFLGYDSNVSHNIIYQSELDYTQL
jgi:hypothetical protein